MRRNRFIYATLVLTTIILGLGSRNYVNILPGWIGLYIGDVLWGMMLFFVIGFIFNRKKISQVIFFSIFISFSIEISQLYQQTWINTIRNTRLGGLVLGYGFLWSDLFCYAIGIFVGSLIEKILFNYFKNKYMVNEGTKSSD